MISPQQFLFGLIEHSLDIVIFKRGDGHEVDREHESLDALRGLFYVGASLNDLCLNSRNVGYLEQGVDVVDVDLPELKDVDRARMVLS